jgi:hypothetical protein
MAIATNVQKETLAQAYAGAATHASLHTTAPGTTGAGELVAAGYARQPITWTAGASDGIVTCTVTFTVAADTNITHVGLWTALTGGTFLDSVTSAVSFVTDGQYVVTLTFTQS